MKKFLLLAMCLILINRQLTAQKRYITRADGINISTTSINDLAKILIDTADVAGLQIGIINDNKPVFLHSYGYANKELKQLNNVNTCFYAASLSKPLFAYLVMKLVDDGIIDLDKPLYQYLPKPLPDYSNYKDLASDDRWKLITARMCLDHTTGFPNWREYNPNDNKKLQIFFTPGTKFAYSGEGIYLLQFVIETITGKPLEILARERVFKPLGMTRTDFLWQPSFESDYAVGHDMNVDILPRNKRTHANAAGSMETTLKDYTKFMSAVMQGEGLAAKTKNEMLSPQIAIHSKREFPSLNSDSTHDNDQIKLSYGLGWGLFTSPYGKAFFKEGHDDGWVNYVISIPDKKIALIILCNSSSGESIFKELVEKITGVTIPWYWDGYTPYRENVKLPENELQQFAGVYDGKLKAIITVENGQLKVESATVNLPKTNLYAQNDHHFFLKIMDTDLEFVKDADGKVVKVELDDEGEHYELTRVK